MTSFNLGYFACSRQCWLKNNSWSTNFFIKKIPYLNFPRHPKQPSPKKIKSVWNSFGNFYLVLNRSLSLKLQLPIARRESWTVFSMLRREFSGEGTTAWQGHLLVNKSENGVGIIWDLHRWRERPKALNKSDMPATRHTWFMGKR